MKKVLIEAEEIDKLIGKLAGEILERYKDSEKLALIGIYTRGVFLAKRLIKHIREVYGLSLKSGSLDITLYRDDWTKISNNPILKATNIGFNVDNMDIVLVDDVLYTGRTTRAGMDALIDFGRPKSIALAVLVDRGHRELPIHADFVGRYIETEKKQSVNVSMKEQDGEDMVILEAK